MKSLKSVIMIWLAMVCSTTANPRWVNNGFSHYLSYENLTITLDEDTAFMSGDFVFNFYPSHALDEKERELYKNWPATLGHIFVYIWIPINAHESQTNLSLFLKTFCAGGESSGVLRDDTRSVFEQTFGIVLNHERNFDSDEVFIISPAQEFEILGMVRKNNYMRPDLYALALIKAVSSSLEDQTRVSLSYKQPLLKTEDETLLFYVPMFSNLTPEQLEKVAGQYRITVRCPEGFELVVKSEIQCLPESTPTEIVILPEHEKPIQIALKKKSTEPTVS